MTMKPQRRGVTILEVLFAILVTSVGLLGAIAVIPVASMQARKGRIADTVAIVAASAEHRFSTEMMARPSRWVVFNYNGADGAALVSPDLIGWNGPMDIPETAG